MPLTAKFANFVCAVLVVYSIVLVTHPRLRMSLWGRGFGAYLALLASGCYLLASKMADLPKLLGVAMLAAAVAVGYIMAGLLAFARKLRDRREIQPNRPVQLAHTVHAGLGYQVPQHRDVPQARGAWTPY